MLGYGTQSTSAGIGSTAGTFNYNTITGAAVPLAAGNQDVSVSINGGAAIDLGGIASSATITTDIANLNAAFQGNATLRRRVCWRPRAMARISPSRPPPAAARTSVFSSLPRPPMTSVSVYQATVSRQSIRFLSAGSAFKVSLGASPASATSGVARRRSSEHQRRPSVDLGPTRHGLDSRHQQHLHRDNCRQPTGEFGRDSRRACAQAAVGRGENQFTYAVNLASSQLTNVAAAESGIRDADLAVESANLTKAQIQLQAGIAALAQANAAPQQVLALLK